MRKTLRLDEDVAATLKRVQLERGATLKQIVNQALRERLRRMPGRGGSVKAFRTQPVDLGERFFPNLDNTWEVLEEAERAR